MKNGKLFRLSTPGTSPYPPPPKKKKKPWALLQSTFMTMVEIQQPNLALQSQDCFANNNTEKWWV